MGGDNVQDQTKNMKINNMHNNTCHVNDSHENSPWWVNIMST